MTQNKLIEALERHHPGGLWAQPCGNIVLFCQCGESLLGVDRSAAKAAWRLHIEALSTAQAQEPVADNITDALKEGRWLSPAPSTPDARAIVEQCVAIAVERSQEWKSAIANGLRRVAVSKDYAEAAQCEAEVIAAALRTKASEIIAAIPSPTPSAPDAALREAVAEVLKWRVGELPDKGYIRDNDLSRAAIGKMLRALSNSGQMEKGAQ